MNSNLNHQGNNAASALGLKEKEEVDGMTLHCVGSQWHAQNTMHYIDTRLGNINFHQVTFMPMFTLAY